MMKSDRKRNKTKITRHARRCAITVDMHQLNYRGVWDFFFNKIKIFVPF